METYRLNSRLVENNKEYLIQTTNDVGLGSVCSEVFVNGTLADSVKLPHPEHIKAEDVLTLVKTTHGEKKKEIESLLKTFRQAMDSGNAEMLYHLGLAFFYKRFYTEARELLTAAVNLNPQYDEALNVLGQTELALGNTDSAVAAAKNAVAAKPNYADYRNNLGEALLAAKHLTEAQKQFEEAIGVNLYYSDAYFNFGLALVREAQEASKSGVRPNLVSKAIDYFNKASLTYVDYKTAAFEKGVAALNSGDLKLGFNLLRKVREDKKLVHGRRYAPYHMKYALHPQWITEQAVRERITFLEQEISRNPNYVDLHLELSRCYLEHSRMIWKKGVDSYKKTLGINPTIERLASHVNKAEDAYEMLAEIISGINKED